jgi:methyl halide transferase
MLNPLDDKYWKERWEQGDIPWDMGGACPALTAYCAQLPDKDVSILIPGAGSGYEVDWLWDNGFHNVTALDWSPQAMERIAGRIPGFPRSRLVSGDFFQFQGQFDLILEQTFFCALDPSKRNLYALKMFSLLKEGGTLAGLLFDFPLDGGPPFGGSELEYRRLFERLFEVKTLERCYNSIKPREGRELFFILKKRSLVMGNEKDSIAS